MDFPNFEYMEWAKYCSRSVAFPLSQSQVPTPSLESLEFALDRLTIDEHEFDTAGPLAAPLSKRDGVDADCIMPCLGTSHGLFLIAAATLKPGDHVIVETPAYEPFVRLAETFGATTTAVERPLERNHLFDLEDFERAFTDRTRLVFMTNLHNPTGVLLPRTDIAKIADMARDRGARVVVDEVYREFDIEVPTAFGLGDHVLAVGSVTKAYGLGALRAGWIYGNPEILRQLYRFNNLGVVNAPAPSLDLAAAVLARPKAIAAMLREVAQERLPAMWELVERRDDLVGARPHGGVVCFPQVRGVDDTRPLTEFLAREFEVQVVPGYFFGDSRCVRIGCGGPLERLPKALARLDEGLDAWASVRR